MDPVTIPGTMIIALLIIPIIAYLIFISKDEYSDIRKFIETSKKYLYDHLDDPSFTKDQLDNRLSLLKRWLMSRFDRRENWQLKYTDEFGKFISIDNLDAWVEMIRQDFLYKRSRFPEVIENKFKNTKVLNILLNFHRRYGNSASEEQIHYLQKVLGNYDFDFEDDALEFILELAVAYKNKKDQIKTLEQIEGKTAGRYLNNVIKYYGEQSLSFLPELKRILKSKFNALYSDESLIDELNKIAEEIRYNQFEKDLLQDSSNHLEILNGYEFEEYIGDIFKRKQYNVSLTKKSQDQGADIILEKLGRRIVVQAKHYSNNVGNKSIQEIVSAVNHYNAEKGVVITSSYFTKHAIELAASNNILLIDRNELNKATDNILYDPIWNSI